MRVRRTLFLVPLLVLCLLFAPDAGGVALAAASTGQQQAGAAAGSGVTDVLKELTDSLRSQIQSLETLNAVLQAENEALKQENALLRSQLDAVTRRLLELEASGGGAQGTTVEKLAEDLRSSVFRVDVMDMGGRLISTGSAVAVTAKDVITNYHVIEDAWSAELVTESGDRIPVLGMTAFSKEWDLAVLRAGAPLEPVKIRSSAVRIGEDVVAIGSPIGLINTVSTGIISALRTMDGKQVIQLSAPISHGSSGGGLFDRRGELIGITFGGMVEGQNLNFAIPIRYVQQVLARAGEPQPLPGASLVTPDTLVLALCLAYPALVVNQYEVPLDYWVVPGDMLAPGAGDMVLMTMDNDAYYTFVEAMLDGNIPENMRTAEAFVREVVDLVDLAYPRADVMVVLVHTGTYQNYPSVFDPEDIKYDPESRTWSVFRPELIFTKRSGHWYSEWYQ